MDKETFDREVDKAMGEAVEALLADNAEIVNDANFLDWLRIRCERKVREKMNTK